MNSYTVYLEDIEKKALETVTASPIEWIDNAVKNRCRIAIDEIINLSIKMCLDLNMIIPSTKEAIVDLAIEQKWLEKPTEIE